MQIATKKLNELLTTENIDYRIGFLTAQIKQTELKVITDDFSLLFPQLKLVKFCQDIQRSKKNLFTFRFLDNRKCNFAPKQM